MSEPTCQTCGARATHRTPAKPLGAGAWSPIGRYCVKHKPRDAVAAYPKPRTFTSPSSILNRLSPLKRSKP